MSRTFTLFFILILGSSAQAGVDSPSFSFNPEIQDPIQRRAVRFTRQHYPTGNFDTVCSGVLVTSNEIYSANHCFEEMLRIGRVPVIDGRQRLQNVFAEIYNPQTRAYVRFTAASVILSTAENTRFARVFLGQEVPYPYGGSISMPVTTSIESCDSNSPIYAAGFGFDENNHVGDFNINVYHFRNAPLLRLDDQDILSKLNLPTHYFDIVYAREGRVCSVDSGGPVFCNKNGALTLLGTIEGFIGAELIPRSQRKTPAPYCRANTKLLINNLNQLQADSTSTSEIESKDAP